MKALTVLQPHAECIAHRGKNVENRGWLPRALKVGDRLAIHAGAQWAPHHAAVYWLGRVPLAKWELPRLCIVAVVTFRGAVGSIETDSPWASGPWCWLLEDVLALREPVPCRGAQGLWTLPQDVEARVLAQIGGAR